MEFDQLIKQLTAAKDDEQVLTLAIVDIVLSTYDPELKQVLTAAVIPHWFNADILEQLLNIETDEAIKWYQQLQTLPFVESYKSRDGFNVHEKTRLALRRQLFDENPEKLKQHSGKSVEYSVKILPFNRSKGFITSYYFYR